MIEKRHMRMKVSDLIPYENNPRNHTDQSIADVKESILQCGDGEPLDEIEIDENNVILAGHGRRLACLDLGIQEVDVTQYIGMTEEQKTKYRILANKTQERSEWDFTLLEQELGKIDLNGYDFGFDLSDDDDNPEIVEDEYDETLPEEPITKRGDVWIMGDHVLMCGDSTREADIRTLTGGQLVDLLLTDPPYNVNYQGNAGTIQNDNLEDSQFRAFLHAAFSAAHAVMKPGAAFYIWHADSEGLNFRSAANETGLTVRECLIWVKNALVLGHSDYQWRHEPCLYGWKDGAAHYFTNSRSESTVIPDLMETDPRKMKKEELVKLLTEILTEYRTTTVIEMDKPTRNGEHPTMKPVALFDYLIRNSTKKRETVLDPFAGSGTTIMACEQNGRKALCMELDERYCDVIVRRWEDFTGEKATLRNRE